jgi:hypothetical protein
LRGNRVVDHREISQSVFPDGAAGGTESMNNFINSARAVRYQPKVGASFNFLPSDIQINQLIKAHKATAGKDNFIGDIYDSKGNFIKDFELENPSVQKLKQLLLESYKNTESGMANGLGVPLALGVGGAGGAVLYNQNNPQGPQ